MKKLLRFHPSTLISRFAVSCLVALTASCISVGQYSPDSSLADGEPISLSAASTIHFVNNQPSQDQHPLFYKGIIVDYHAFTESVVTALNNRMPVSQGDTNESGKLKLNVAITDVVVVQDGHSQTNVSAEVAFPDGTKKEFYTSGVAIYGYGSSTKMVDAAFVELVNEIASDEKVGSYRVQ